MLINGNEWLAAAGWICMAIVMAAALYRPSVRFLSEHRITAVNFAGSTIPTSAGLYLLAVLIGYNAVLQTANWIGLERLAEADSVYLFTMSAVVLLGLLDDLVGDKRVKGFSGHFRMWMKHGAVTTGLLKAVGITIMAMYASLRIGGSLAEITAGALVLALSANAFNLLDVRPGRSLKAFLPFAFLLIAVAAVNESTLVTAYMAPVTAAALQLFRYDVKAEVMLGDTGANALGFALGYWLLLQAGLWLLTGALAMLILFHIAAAYGSISERIDRSRWLHWLDRLGRNGY
jgi:UDP-GlcNAc:undecaprenyl-phosphate GlcNAc-1-phosphate transferase